jgi:hypothetical protein
MPRVTVLCVAAAVGLVVVPANRPLRAAPAGPIEYRLLATSKTSTMEKELNEAAEAGFQFKAVMGGETAIGGNEVVAVVTRSGEARSRYSYKLLATSKTSTMEREMQEAADAGFEYKDQTVFESLFGGKEVVVIMERDKDSKLPRSQYKLLATTKTSTLEKELLTVGAAGYGMVGMTVAKTALGGKELVAITKRDK